MDDGARAASARRLVGLTLRVLIVAGAMLAGLYAYRLQFVQPRTDDAAVRANVVGIAPQVSGPIVDLRVVDNQHVNAGDLLFAVDCRPYEARLARTRADLALALKEVDAQRKSIAAPASSTPWPLAVMRRLPSTNHTTSARGPRTSWPRSAISTHAWKPPRRPCARPSSTWATARFAHPSTPT